MRTTLLIVLLLFPPLVLGERLPLKQYTVADSADHDQFSSPEHLPKASSTFEDRSGGQGSAQPADLRTIHRLRRLVVSEPRAVATGSIMFWGLRLDTIRLSVQLQVLPDPVATARGSDTLCVVCGLIL